MMEQMHIQLQNLRSEAVVLKLCGAPSIGVLTVWTTQKLGLYLNNTETRGNKMGRLNICPAIIGVALIFVRK